MVENINSQCDELENDPLISIAMQIILHAGDARNYAIEALDKAKVGDSKNSARLIKKAHESITLAHEAQTKVIQNAMNGTIYQHNILFIHAQDTLMTIKSELMTFQELIELYVIVVKLKGI